MDDSYAGETLFILNHKLRNNVYRKLEPVFYGHPLVWAHFGELNKTFSASMEVEVPYSPVNTTQTSADNGSQTTGIIEKFVCRQQEITVRLIDVTRRFPSRLRMVYKQATAAQ